MSNILKTLVMMAEQKENFKIGDKTFQIIEVKEAEQPQPNCSHLVGKFVRCIKDINIFGVKQDSWYQVDHIGRRDFPIVIVGNGTLDSRSWTEDTFDLTNPQDENPDEVKKILVPSVVRIMDDRPNMGIVFGTNRVLLSKPMDTIPYKVLDANYFNPIQCELIKCERAELKKGDVAFRTNVNEGNFDSLSGYCIIIDKLKYCYIDRGEDVTVGNSIPHHWYKLQPIEQ